MLITLQIIASIISSLLLCGLAIKLVHILQLSGYKLKPFIRWCVTKRSRYTFTLVIIGVLGFGFTAVIRLLLLCFEIGDYWSYFGLLFYLFLATLTIYLNFNKNDKVTLRYTWRVKRLLFMIWAISLIVSFAVLKLSSLAVWVLPLVTIVLPVFVIISSLILSPFESLIKLNYIRKAKKKLFSDEYKNVIRIGITGSYGKTTCKNILEQILSQKYQVVSSPASYNTPMGFCRTVLQELKPGTQVIIMEMGAKRIGDIKQMCDLFKPHHGILTSIGKAHLETFGNMENIRKGKMELIDAIPDGGVKIIGDGIKSNLDICLELARTLGVDTVPSLEQVPHRLEVTQSATGVTIIDDSYNSNPDGCCLALAKLKELKTNRAIVMTPGMIELGTEQYNENKQFAEAIAEIADAVIIVGETNKKAILDGLKNKEYNKENIHCVPDVENAKALFPKLLSKGDVLLIENDLPDNF